MPFAAKHWFQRLCLAGAGVLISSFGPDQVPAAWKPVLFWFGVALAIFAAFIWPLIGFAMKRGRRFPERHKIILQELAAPLATVQEQALTYGQRDFSKMANAKAQAEELISEIPYDHETVKTVRDFLQACAIVTDTHNTADETREARQDVARISPALFRYLHDGRAVDRRKVDLPDWCRVGGGKSAELTPPSPATKPIGAGYAPASGGILGMFGARSASTDETITAAQAAVTQQMDAIIARKERSEDRIPFVRIRDLAPAYGLGLAPHDPDASNVAYRIEGALRQAVVDGDLQVWGRRYRSPPNNEPMVPIPSLHFEEYGFAHGVLNHPSDNAEARTNTLQMATWGQKGKTGATYYDLHLSFGATEAVLSKVSRGEAP